ncbi:MAG: hypothetical protein KTR31_18750, partial [Myxococcales bacterium]|nr:hypothetical protein [Myxococcales bacterium]
MRKQLVTTVLAVAWTVGCGGDGTGTTSEDVLSLTTDAQQIRVRIDGSTTLDVGLSGAVGAVEVAVEGLPVGLTAEPVSVDDGGDTAQLTLSAAASAEMAGPLALQVVATDEEGGTDSLELPLYVAGAPGALDTSFSFDGQATYRPTDREYDACRDLLLDSHSRLVVSGVGQGAN